jgi:F0F1-type ATP synthase epsilon subunit
LEELAADEAFVARDIDSAMAGQDQNSLQSETRSAESNVKATERMQAIALRTYSAWLVG